MQFFCVFTKQGRLLYKEGLSPIFLNALIRSLDPKLSFQTKKVQNLFMYCKIIKKNVYLTFNDLDNTDYIESKMNEYNKIHLNEPNSKENKIIKNEKGKKFVKKRNLKEEISLDSLDFSENVEEEQIFVENNEKVYKNRIFKFNLFNNNIYKEDLRKKITDKLIEKNVHSSLAKKLVGNILNEFGDNIKEKEFKNSLKRAVKDCIEGVDHEDLKLKIKEKKGIFSFCFVGVNGVGKSTNLAKVCYWLLNCGFKVLIAACDTFRAGAIEQLKVHVESFNRAGHHVGLYEKGYGKDDATVARNAIKMAEKEGYNVILIDTAGRMHNNVNLMNSLCKLSKVNNIDHYIYVGEALVGNDSLDHLQQFNKALKEGNKKAKINSLLITKIDTVDDKIGQVLNMTYFANCPILFLGTGQNNAGLTAVDINVITDMLMD